MVRKSATLAADVERRRLLALMAVYDAIQAAIAYNKEDVLIEFLAELRNQAVTLTALAPPVEIAPDAASEQLTNMFLSLFPGLASTPAQEDGPA